MNFVKDASMGKMLAMNAALPVKVAICIKNDEFCIKNDEFIFKMLSVKLGFDENPKLTIKERVAARKTKKNKAQKGMQRAAGKFKTSIGKNW